MISFSIRTESTGGRLLFALSGELDLATAPEVERTLHGELDWEQVTLVVIDLRELVFLDSSGLRALFLVDDAARDHGARAVFVRGSQAVQRIFEVTALDERLEMVDDPEILSTDEPQPRP